VTANDTLAISGGAILLLNVAGNGVGFARLSLSMFGEARTMNQGFFPAEQFGEFVHIL
jgi:hypothetical protein